ncbi:hypothetical protein MMC18_005136 [Xylographa bjoerkii]|nr:hypothetical protein [Xylographa bjoerkii]
MELRKRNCPKEFYLSPQRAPKNPKSQKRDHQDGRDGRTNRRSGRIVALQQSQAQKKQPTSQFCDGFKPRAQKSKLQEPKPAFKTSKARKGRRKPSGPHDIEGLQEQTKRKAGAALERAQNTVQRSLHLSPNPRNKRRRLPAPVQEVVGELGHSNHGNSTVYRCPQCAFPCWICNSATILQEPVPSIEEDVEEEIEENDPMAASSATALSITSSNKKRNRNDGLIFIGPKETGFETFILGAINCFLDDGSDEECSYLTAEDIPDSSLEQKLKLTATDVFLNIDNPTATKRATHISRFHKRAYDETTLTMDIARYLAPTDYYTYRNGPETVVSLCRYKWKPGKSIQGPSVPIKSGYTYDWEIEPDMTYMVSVNLFKRDIRERMYTPDLTCVLAEPDGVCPYLTFEFKCAEKNGKETQARCQIAAASLFWIYQRKQIRDMLLSSDNTVSNVNDLRHYSIILISTNYQVWLTQIEGNRYVVRKIYSGSLNTAENLQTYVKWWNAIHTWGLGAYAQSFKKDVEALWEKKQGNTLATTITPPLSETLASPSTMPLPVLFR